MLTDNDSGVFHSTTVCAWWWSINTTSGPWQNDCVDVGKEASSAAHCHVFRMIETWRAVSKSEFISFGLKHCVM